MREVRGQSPCHVDQSISFKFRIANEPQLWPLAAADFMVGPPELFQNYTLRHEAELWGLSTEKLSKTSFSPVSLLFRVGWYDCALKSVSFVIGPELMSMQSR